MIKLSQRVLDLTESATLKMAQAARELSQNGMNVINLSLGEPDFDTPEFIKESAITALLNGATKYTPVAGLIELRQAISNKFQTENSLQYTPEQIVVSNGAKQAFANLCSATLDYGDEVILLAPYWVSYYEIIKLNGGIPVVIDSTVANNFVPSIESITLSITHKTKLIVYSSPCNPTGTVFNHEFFEKLVKALQNYPQVVVVSDEIYEQIIFDEKHISIGSYPGMIDRTVTINGFSKAFSTTGWRLGYMGAPKYLADACIKIQGQYTSGAGSFVQKAGITAIQNTSACVEMRDIFRKRRDTLLAAIHKTLPHWKCSSPEGAFYVLPDVSADFGKKTPKDELVKDADDLTYYLLNEAHVAMVSGSAFGAQNCIRISYSISEEQINLAVSRIAKALSRLD